jgi:alanine racemase
MRGARRAEDLCVKGERPTQASVDLRAIRANYAEALRRAGGRSVIAVVKADAYGHGGVPVARALVAGGCPRLAVATLAEAAALRQAAIAVPILALGGVHDAGEADDAVALGVTPVVHHAGHVELLARAAAERGRRLPVHVEIDTGMHRMGVSEVEAPGLLAQVAARPALALQGVYTHLARADEPDPGPTHEQLRRFAGALAAARELGVTPGLVHVANSAGLVTGEGLGSAVVATAAVRLGILLYGVQPVPHVAVSLEPAMTLRTRVAAVRRIGPGDPVGYAASWRAERSTQVATLPIGYADGVPWSLANRGEVLLNGERAPIVGRVSMDFLTVDAGDAPVEVGDEAVLFGVSESGETLAVEELARAAGTLSYELLVRVGARVPRIFIG